MRLDIDMSFSLTEVDGSGAQTGEVRGSVTAAGRHIEVRTDGVEAFPAVTPALLKQAREFAAGLADRDLSLSIIGPAGEIVRLGSVKSSVLQQAATRSKHIRLGALKGLPKLALTRGEAEQTSGSLVPPPTPWPLVPTVNRRVERKLTTTHYGLSGAGRPRLVLVKDPGGSGSGRVLEFNLTGEHTVIGSDASCDLQLSETDPLHAEIRHDGSDEYILTRHGAVGGSVYGKQGTPVTLRTGSRIQMGPWRIVFLREEYADHGRPFGGRQGGEYSYQKPQPNPYRG